MIADRDELRRELVADTLGEVLVAHWQYWDGCRCGWKPVHPHDVADQLRAHLADVLLPAIESHIVAQIEQAIQQEQGAIAAAIDCEATTGRWPRILGFGDGLLRAARMVRERGHDA